MKAFLDAFRNPELVMGRQRHDVPSEREREMQNLSWIFYLAMTAPDRRTDQALAYRSSSASAGA
jgi:hypothetical protein